MTDMDKATEPNWELFRRIAHQIRERPQTYDQGWFGSSILEIIVDDIDKLLFCGTRCCIAGHALIAKGIPPGRSNEILGKDIPTAAKEILGLSARQAGYLFYSWPRRWWTNAGVSWDRGYDAAPDILEAMADQKTMWC